MQRRVGNRDLVVLLVLAAKTLEDLDSLIDSRRLDDDRLESALESSVLLDVLAILVERRCTDALKLAARKRRLEHVARVDRAFGGTRTNERVQLVDEQDDVLVLRDLVHDRLEALLELAAILRSRDHRRHVERQHAMLAKTVGALAVGDELRQTFDDRSLADARLTDENRIVLLAASQDLHHALDFLRAADRRIELRLRRKLRQIAAEMIECGSLRLLLALARRCRSAGGAADDDADGAPPCGMSVPSRRSVSARAASRLMPASVRTCAAIPFSSRRSPSSRCSVPT